jgi:hypothetical protein
MDCEHVKTLLAWRRLLGLLLRRRRSRGGFCIGPCSSIARERGARCLTQQSRGWQRRAEPLKERHVLLLTPTIQFPKLGNVTDNCS